MPDADPTDPLLTEKPSVPDFHGMDPRDLIVRGLRNVTHSGPWEPPSPEELGRLLPQYRIECLIGRGGMGAVYKGIQPELERPVAIKILPVEFAADEHFVSRFKREARILAKLQHSRIITIHDYGQTREGHLYFVMEYIDGTNLREILRGPGLKADEALLVVSQICDALYSAHKQGVVHRDIKPENVLITRDGYVKLADFGLARPPPEDAEVLTGENALMGTPAYMAPEQGCGEADHRSDIYALGVMLYEMLTGKRPQGVFQPPSASVQVDVRLDQVVIKALQQEPERRYQEVTELKKDVDNIRTTPPGKAWLGLAEAKHKGPAAVAILAVVLLAAAVVFLWPKRPRHAYAPMPLSPGPSALATPGAIPAPAATPSLNLPSVPPVVAVIDKPLPLASTPSPQLPPAHTPAPSATPKPATEVEKWFAQVDGPQEEAFQKQVMKPYTTGVAGLRTRYLAALDAGIAKSSAANRLDEALAWRTERQAFEKAQNVAPNDDGATAGIEALRVGFRQQLAKLDHDRTARAKALFAQYDAVLAQNQTLLTERQRLDDALLLKTKREEIARAWLDPPVLIATSATGLLASKSQPFENSLGMKFVPVLITGGPTSGQRVLFSVWDTRVQDYEVFLQESKREWSKPDFPQGPTHPALEISWDDAQLFCQWLTRHEQAAGWLPEGFSYRLPSDHEWSCAAELGAREDAGVLPSEKGGKIDDVYPWGTQWPPPKGAGNYMGEEMHSAAAGGKYAGRNVIAGYDDGFVNTSPVGSFAANRFGLFDMGGNVTQWCEDWYDKEQNFRVVRGSWWGASGRLYLLSSARYPHSTSARNDGIGFRCVLAPVSAVPPAPAPLVSHTPPAATSTLLASKSLPFENSLGMKFVPVPITGGPTGGQRVLFSVWDTRVQDYEVFVNETKREWMTPDFEQGPTHPAVNVRWDDATAFCAWLTERERKAGKLGANEVYRLPSDHEWSCAVGIGEREDAATLPIDKSDRIKSAYPWGAQWPPPENAGNYASEEALPLQAGKPPLYVIPGYHDGYAYTSPVGSYAANRFGLFDMGGNVWQWCQDWSDQYQKKRVERGACWANGDGGTLLSSTRLPGTLTGRATFLGFRCVLAAISTSTPVPVVDSKTATQFTTKIANGQATITGYTGSGGAVDIPTTINTGAGILPVTSIERNAFQNKKGTLTRVSIPSSVTSIGSGAFNFCGNLTAITVDPSNPAYSSGADGVLFDKNQTTLIQYPGHKAGSYTIPGSVTSIAFRAFNGSVKLTSVTIGDSVKSIGDSAFYFCPELTGVAIGKNVTSIGGSAFGDCNKLTRMTVDPSNPAYSNSGDDVLFDKNQTTLIQYPGGKAGSYTIPSRVTCIGGHAFWACPSLTSVIIPNGVTNIESAAFGDCTRLTNATFKGNAPQMGKDAFNSNAGGFKVHYSKGATGFSSPTWTDSSGDAYPAVPNSITSARGTSAPVDSDPAPRVGITTTTVTAASNGQPFVNSLGMKFVPVPIIGGPTGGQRVLFSIWDTRVQDYEVFVQENKREWSKPEFPQGPTEPAIIVTWDDAHAFCQWLTDREQAAGRLPSGFSYRLPSDHEWSCAVGIGDREDAAVLPSEKARKIDGFPWGAQWPPPKGAGNYAGEEFHGKTADGKGADHGGVIIGFSDGFVNTSPVGSFAANQFGLFDMGGNVLQWCEDWIDKDQTNRVVRGSSWDKGNPSNLKSSARFRYSPAASSERLGFRCVLASTSTTTPPAAAAPIAASNGAGASGTFGPGQIIDLIALPDLDLGARGNNPAVYKEAGRLRIEGDPSRFSEAIVPPVTILGSEYELKAEVGKDFGTAVWMKFPLPTGFVTVGFFSTGTVDIQGGPKHAATSFHGNTWPAGQPITLKLRVKLGTGGLDDELEAKVGGHPRVIWHGRLTDYEIERGNSAPKLTMSICRDVKYIESFTLRMIQGDAKLLQATAPSASPSPKPSPATVTSAPAKPKPETDVSVPVDFKFTAVDGREVDLAKLRGKVVLVEFWATWCGPCMSEVQHVLEAYHRFHDQGFEIVGISFDEDKAALQRVTQEKGMTWPQYFDGKLWQNDYGLKFGIHSLPTMWLVDRQGRVATTNGREDLADKVEKLLAGKTP